jgi:DeoR family transcriptional regulator of aga operon/DeoR family fructose operon transcriptional repressor
MEYIMQHERRNDILVKIRKLRTVKVSDLMDEYQVSIETIRKDLEYLEKKGQITRVYGGAILHGFYGDEPEYESREILNYPEKQAIGKKAAEFINDGDVLFMDLGTTPMELAKQLRFKKNLTVITNAALTAMELLRNGSNCKVIFLGGELRKEEFASSGLITEQILKNFYATKTIISIGGISQEHGISDYHLNEACIRRLMIEQSNEVIGLADYTKFGVIAMNHICPLKKLSVLVSDWSVPVKVLEEYRSLGINIVTAPKPEERK